MAEGITLERLMQALEPVNSKLETLLNARAVSEELQKGNIDRFVEIKARLNSLEDWRSANTQNTHDIGVLQTQLLEKASMGEFSKHEERITAIETWRNSNKVQFTLAYGAIILGGLGAFVWFLYWLLEQIIHIH